MPQYFSTFISGFQKLIKETLNNKFKDIEIDLLLDGLVIFSTKAQVREIQSLRFFNNNFFLLNKLKIKENDKTDWIVKKLSANLDLFDILSSFEIKGRKSFRIAISRESQLISIDKLIIKKIELKIIYQTKFFVNPLKPDLEFWFMIRKEGWACFGLRLRSLQRKRIIQKGELRPELAHIMCLLSEPSDEDVFLDPFAGSGAIPFERVTIFSYKKVFVSDKNEKLLINLSERFNQFKNIKIKKMNALQMNPIKNHSITKIVTDPPWGFFNQSITNFLRFYSDMMNEYNRILTPKGLIIIIAGRKDEFDKVIKNFSKHFILIQFYDILVSGKKARLYKIRRATLNHH